MGKKAKTKGYPREVVRVYSACDNSDVNDEVELLLAMYEGAYMTQGKRLTDRILKVPLQSEVSSKRSLTVLIQVTQGYPYVMPRIALDFPRSVHIDDDGALSEEEVREIEKTLREDIQPSGAPLLMHIISAVDLVVNRDPVAAQDAKDAALARARKEIGSKSAGQSPSLTPVPMRAGDAMKLSVLTLHLLRLCCQLRNPESKEDADENFNYLASYLIDNGIALPPSAKVFNPWNPKYFSDAFTREAKAAASKVDGRTDLTSWLWQNVEFSSNIRHGTAGRYAQEFIEQRLLGSGGFGPVYVCRKKVDARLYAVKKVVMRKSETSNVLQEVTTLAALSHKNIVRYYDAWIEDGCSEELLQYVDDDVAEEAQGEEGTRRPEAERGGPGQSSASDASETTPCRSPSRGSSSCTATSESSDDAETSAQTSDSDWDGTDDETSSSSSSSSSASSAGDSPVSRVAMSRNYQTLYIQMELCSARSLRHLIESGDASTDGKNLLGTANGVTAATVIASSILRQLLTVIAHTHHNGIVHRDLKPDNILFETQPAEQSEGVGTIRVVDFGLARAVGGVRRNASTAALSEIEDASLGFTASGNRGSVLYCAPELERGDDYGFKVDEFSIGMIALEMWLVIAGKGFRDRFSIMVVAWRTGELPDWFRELNPSMSDLIGRLICVDPNSRATCEQILSECILPGEPPEITEAMGTVDRFSDQVFPKIMQLIARKNGNAQRASVSMRDAATWLASGSQSNIAQAVTLVATLHGHTAVPCFDHLLPLTPQLQKLGVSVVVDTGCHCFGLADVPQFASTAFLGLQDNADIGPFYQFYYKARPFAVFVSPVPRRGVFNELMMEPLLSLYHLLSIVDLSQSHVKLVISHADWLNTTYPTEVGSRPPPEQLVGLESCLDNSDSVGPALYRIIDALQTAGLPAQAERDEFIRRFVTVALETRGYYGKHMEAGVSVHLDPLMQPSDHLVCRAALEFGVLFQCYHSKDVPFAIGCSLDNFASSCIMSRKGGDVNAFSVSIDLRELGTIGKHVKIADTDSLMLDGVGIRRKDLYSQAHLNSSIRAAVTLWKGNVRACLRADNDVHSFTKALKVKQIRWLLVDGTHLRGVTSNVHGKGSGESADIPLDKLCMTVRRTVHPEKAGAGLAVVFPMGRADDDAAEEAKRVFATPNASVAVALVPLKTVDVERCLRDSVVAAEETETAGKAGERKVSHVPDTSAAVELQRWLRDTKEMYALIAVYSLPDDTFSFTVNGWHLKKRGPNKRNHTGAGGGAKKK